MHPNNGIRDDSARGSHLSVNAELMKGEFDDELEQPFEGDIQIELLNKRRQEDHGFNRKPHEPGWFLQSTVHFPIPRLMAQEVLMLFWGLSV